MSDWVVPCVVNVIVTADSQEQANEVLMAGPFGRPEFQLVGPHDSVKRVLLSGYTPSATWRLVDGWDQSRPARGASRC